MPDPVIHLVFKTHLDIGFTDHAARVRAQYHRQFIPQAIATGEHFHAENPEEPLFIWTTGAWLIWDHLEHGTPQQVRRLERAIGRGLIAWHALPFTTHTELMSPALFAAGLSYAAELDWRFGRRTIAAKMTDVPGHTLGMVPILAAAGVRFLHLGVNSASPGPEVPPIFRWRAPDGSEVVVMYQGDYGLTDFPAGPEVGLSFAHTSDNAGPQDVRHAVEDHRILRRAMPEGTVIRASTLDAFGAEMWARREGFPVVTQEIGDSWIHGAGSDPVKLARFRALQRVFDGFGAQTPARLAFGRGLAMVAEHTWGVDIKSYLRDQGAWDRADFEALRARDHRFAYTEASWAEQRAYLDQAVAALASGDRAAAEAGLAGTLPSPAPTPSAGAELRDGGWIAELDPGTGDVTAITAPDGERIAGREGGLIGFRHESYDAASMRAHMDSYLLHREEWAVLDHDKPGLAAARTARRGDWAPRLTGVAGGNVAVAALPDAAHTALGAPGRIEIGIAAAGGGLLLSLTLRGKPANRMPEAGFLQVTPEGGGWELRKMGLWHRAGDCVRRGGAQLQAVEAVRWSGWRIALMDAALVGPAGVDFMRFHPDPPDWGRGLRVNLYNNKWGTNFPMWWEGDALFRFLLVREGVSPWAARP